MAKQASPFEAMPIELHMNVLTLMCSPEDVLATIKASPTAFRAFIESSEQIYAAVLKNGLAPEVYHVLLAIINAPDHIDCPSVSPALSDDERNEAAGGIISVWEALDSKVYYYLQAHAKQARYPTPSANTNATKFKAQIRTMVGVYLCLSEFVNFYPVYARANASGTPLVFSPAQGFGQRIQEDRDWPPLNDTERLRLQRGLLRYELCCRVNGLPTVAAGCNKNLVGAFRVPGEAYKRVWWYAGLQDCLRTDEEEEAICASIHVKSLFQAIRWGFGGELYSHIHNLTQARVGAALGKNGGHLARTAREWLS